ncbi:TIGR03086 family metal-binding protein [Streptomyces sp. B1866]|uniref:TIGR03086 family metal-binding protein n=1 Tax=Streptomyces sp. B1866 TaxID=3075431 RepID=UPI00288DF0EC|nr:TIGR03086 family metal-binding protein [Streptomyces sp. B1866]MDT3400321.1 TIGR03086 family metal-binding protein [Streptomyces sp. B1866]
MPAPPEQTAQTPATDLGPVARQVAALLPRIADGQLTAPTPCTEYSVAALLDHFMGLTVAFEHAARKAPDPAPPSSDAAASRPQASADRLDPGWRTLLPRRLEELAAAWRDPAAWRGSVTVAGATLPAEMMGVVALTELVVHGWDLARATGQPFDGDPASTGAVLALLNPSADGPAAAGVYGPPVPVPAGAPPLDRAVGLSGRDPAWSA